jgi:hypothetical protein
VASSNILKQDERIEIAQKEKLKAGSKRYDGKHLPRYITVVCLSTNWWN